MTLNDNRFEFGENWSKFLSSLDDKQIEESEKSLKKMLKVESLSGKSFLDIGSGSGLFSLSAKRLGASVHSFDYDASSVECTRNLKNKYFPNDDSWSVEQGDALNLDYLKSLGEFDIVYSWGVLHHTGDMWKALEYASNSVRNNGTLFIALYNDQGIVSDIWKFIKKSYNMLPKHLKGIILYPAFLRLWGPTTIKDFIKRRPFYTWKNYKLERGMSPWNDVVDWVGGWPFEVAKPTQIIEFYKKRDFTLINSNILSKGLGCNEFVFVKNNKA